MTEVEIIQAEDVERFKSAQSIYISSWINFTVDLSEFKNLRSARIVSDKHKNLGLCRNLEELTLAKVNEKKDQLSTLYKLCSLDISQGNLTNLSFLANLPNLQILRLAYLPKLTDVTALENSPQLRELEVFSCKKARWANALQNLRSLEKLILDGCKFENLEWIKQLPKLSHLSLVGSDVRDGNISPAKHIAYVAIDNRRHYNYKFDHSDLRLIKKK